jgi:hypothetical protein
MDGARQATEMGAGWTRRARIGWKRRRCDGEAAERRRGEAAGASGGGLVA